MVIIKKDKPAIMQQYDYDHQNKPGTEWSCFCIKNKRPIETVEWGF